MQSTVAPSSAAEHQSWESQSIPMHNNKAAFLQIFLYVAALIVNTLVSSSFSGFSVIICFLNIDVSSSV
nr:unnamed protein product [Callosobruchus analis]